MASALVFGIGLGALPDPSQAQFKKLRYEESYPEQPAIVHAFDAVKHVPLGLPGTYLTLGGEGRWRWEYAHNPAFGSDPQDESGVRLQRLSLLADLHLGPTFRVFSQLTSALAGGRAGGPSPVDENQLEAQNLFADLVVLDDAAVLAYLRGGRQELAFGSGRIIDVREGPNVRRTFDGGRVGITLGHVTLDAIAVSPREDRRGVFDDETDDSQRLWGLYSVQPLDLPGRPVLDLYYLGYENDASRYDQETAREERHSLGARFSGAQGGWDWNWETLYQFGTFGAGTISAWTVASDTGFTLDTLPWRPRVALSANVASGDRNPLDPDLQSFNALFPRGNYFSEDATVGPRNFFNVHPFLTLSPHPDLTLTVHWNGFWRLETSDGVYTPSGQLLRGAGGSRERYVGNALSLSAEWQIDRNWSFSTIYAHFEPGAFIEDTGPAEAIDFVEGALLFRF